MVDLGQKKVDSFRLFLCPVGKFLEVVTTYIFLLLSQLTIFNAFHLKD